MHEYTTIRIQTKLGWFDVKVTDRGSVEVLAERSLAIVPNAGNVARLFITRKA